MQAADLDHGRVRLDGILVFVTVAEERHLANAAARLHVSPSALSLRLQGLEADLGVRLLVRSSRRVDLTAAGARLLPKALAVLKAVAELRHAVSDDR